MRLLATLPHVPWPPVGGGRTRSWFLLSQLAERHEVHVLALVSPDEPAASATPLPFASFETAPIPAANPPRFSPAWVRLRVRSLRHPAAAFFQPQVERRFGELVRTLRPDVVVYDMSWMLPYARAAGTVPGVVNQHNYDPLITARMASGTTGLEAMKWRAYLRITEAAERRNLRPMRGIAACSEEDAALFRRVAPHADVAVVPNGVDTAGFTVTAPGAAVVMTGSYSYRPNADGARRLAQRIWPLVRRARPDAALRLVGRHGETVLADLVGLPGVTVVGTVDDIGVEFARARVAAAPIDVGGGTRLKILEAFAAGRPVVTTRIGTEGIAVTEGREAFVRDDDAGFADALVRLLNDESLAAAMGARGRVLVESHYDWRRSTEEFDALLARSAS